MRWLSRHRVTALIVVVGLVAVLAAAYAGRHDQAYVAAYDPGNPDGNGAQAVARVLDHQGVDVEVVRSADALDRTTADGATTIVVTSTDHLGITTTSRLLQHQGAADLVVVAPGPQLVRELGLRSYPRSARLGDDVAAGCPAYDGLVVRVSAGATYGAPGCFRTGDGSLLAEPRHQLTLLGASDVLSNDQILEGDNAAVALRLLGGRRHLVWYVPALADLGGADSVSAASLLPDWLVPSLWLLGVAGVALVVWRARRLGPLAREPLPVEVKAVETTRNLGRLYRRSGDRAHAAEALRLAARTRIADRLRLPRRTDPSVLATDVAARTGRPLAEVASLLSPTTVPPADDRALAALAQQLTELDREVSRR